MDESATSVCYEIRVRGLLGETLVVVAGDRFVIRRYSPALTIGGGSILDAHLPKLSRNTRPEMLQTLASASLQERIELMAKLEGLHGITIREIQARTGIRIAALPRDFSLIKVAPDRWIHPDAIADFRRRAMEFLDRYFKDNRLAINVPKGEFVQKLIPRADVFWTCCANGPGWWAN